MSKTAIYPGSFDPFTNGHMDMVRKAADIFEHFYIVIGVNSDKRRSFPAETMAEAGTRLRFCFHAVYLVAALERFSGEALRLFSAEIEYSDENVEKICRWLTEQIRDKN